MEMLLTVDTLAFASRLWDENDIFQILGLDKDVFETARPEFNYNYACFYQGIKISFGGTAGFKTHVYFSGKGCRTFEDIHSDGFSWFQWILFFHQADVDFRRIDIACDDFTDLINVPKCDRYFRSRKIAGSCRTFSSDIKINVGKSGNISETFYAGSPSSNCLVRIYNKALERGFEDGLINGHPWYRCEMQLRRESANQFISEWISCEDLSSIYCGHLLEFIRFTTKCNDGRNSQRLPIASWWLKFCNNANRIKFVSAPGSEYNYNKCRRYTDNMAASSIKARILAEGWTPKQAYDWFTRSTVHLNNDQKVMVKSLGKKGTIVPDSMAKVEIDHLRLIKDCWEKTVIENILKEG